MSPEARYDRTSSKNHFWGAVQDSGPPLLSAQAGAMVLLCCPRSPASTAARTSRSTSNVRCPFPCLMSTIAPACADRSCGPPKPGAAYENQPDGAAGGPLGGRRGPMGPRRARGDAVACPWGPNTSYAPIRDSRATCRMTTCSELR